MFRSLMSQMKGRRDAGKPVQQTKFLVYFKKCDLFSRLRDAEIEELAGTAVSKSFPEGTFIIQKDASGDDFYLVVSGRVKVTLYSEDGHELILAELGAGEFFGEMSLLDGKPRSAMVIALEPTAVLVVRRRDFLAIVNRNPAMAVQLIEALCQRLRKADETIERIASFARSIRKSRILRWEMEPTGEREDEDGQVSEQHPSRQGFVYLDHLERIARAQPRSNVQAALIDLIGEIRGLWAEIRGGGGPRFGEVARQMGLVTAEQLQTGLGIQLEEEQQGLPRRHLGEILVGLGILTPKQAEQVALSVARQGQVR